MLLRKIVLVFICFLCISCFTKREAIKLSTIDDELAKYENGEYDYWKNKDLRKRKKEGLTGGTFLVVPLKKYEDYFKQVSKYFTMVYVSDFFINRVEKSGILEKDKKDKKLIDEANLMCHILLSNISAQRRFHEMLIDRGNELLNDLNKDFKDKFLGYLEPSTDELQICLLLLPEYKAKNDLAIANLRYIRRKLEESGATPLEKESNIFIPMLFP